MIEDTGKAAPQNVPTRNADTLLLAAGGVAAAFGAASCCALPLLLGTLGLGSAWFVTVASIAAPHRLALLAVAIGCLAAGGVLQWRRRGIAACETGACRNPVITSVVTCLLSLGAVLVALGWIFA
jgi:mercuric ion transport protein